MNWDEFEKETEKLASKIDYKPDIIVGITRGAVVLARVLCNKLGVKEMFCISVKKFGEDRKVMTDILEDLKDKNILLVEDMLETARSLIVAKKYLESKGANVKTACFYTMKINEIVPDFSLNEVDEVVSFPWD